MTDKVLARPLEILLVDDNPADIRLVQEGFREEGMLPYNLHVVQDGVEALEFLQKEGKFNPVPTPDIILLDLNMPRKNGREVIAELKQNPALRYIPVIILTSTDKDAEILNLYDLGASSFITKPVDADKFVQMVKSLKKWFSVIKLPDNIYIQIRDL